MILFQTLLVFSWLFLLSLVILFMTPYCGGVWDREAVGFFYDQRLKCSDIYGHIELYVTIVFPALSITFYMFIVYLLKKVSFTLQYALTVIFRLGERALWSENSQKIQPKLAIPNKQIHNPNSRPRRHNC